MKVDLDELERLAAKATPGPWTADNWSRVWHEPKQGVRRTVADCVRVTVKSPKQHRANARLIAAMHEALPELIAEHRALREKVRRLERQRDYLAKLLGDLCTAQKDGQCPLFYACPASGFGWSCGNAIKEDWVYAAIQAAKEDGE